MSPIGVIGVGHLMRHLTPGLMRAKIRPELLLSPRNAATSAELARRHGCGIARDNREIVERCDMVLIAVRPLQAADALTGLPWRAGQKAVSLMAGTRIQEIERIVEPAAVLRAMPVTAAEFGESPTCIFPMDGEVARILAPAGRIIPLRSEAEFEPASVIACYYGWAQKLAAEMAGWLAEKGVEPGAARELTAAMTRAAATTVLERPGDSLESLILELCLPGSYTGQGFEVLSKRDAFAPWSEAADALLARMRQDRD